MKRKQINTISFILLILAVFYAFYSQMPEKEINKDISSTEFSTYNAFQKLAHIAKKPHYVGTIEHTNVRKYIISELEKLGLEVTIQEQEAVNIKWRGGAKIYNILTRIKGTDSGKALLLLSHYDSTPHSSYGGSDAGSGVVTILESLRVYLNSEKKPKNDIIILISDAEELGLLGAKAFVKHHPWAKEVGLVLNLEARGSGGPSYMLLETNGGNHQFIEAFSNAKTPYPVANSLMYSIYKMLPNDTDLTVFREDGDIDGFNFAFIDDFYDYHTAQDTQERLDNATLTHQGSYIMTLLNYFSKNDLSSLKGQSDDVFFNFPFFGMVYYPFNAVFPLIIVASLIFIVLFVYGFRKRKLSLKGILRSFIPFISSLLVAVLVGYFGWKLVLYIHPQYTDILQGFPYNGHMYLFAFSSIVIGIVFWFYNYFIKKERICDLLFAPIFIWFLINWAIAYWLKGAGFFIIPLIGMLISLGVLLFSKKISHNSILLFTLLAIPTFLLFPPLIKMFPVGLGMKIIFISLVFIVLLLGSILPIIASYTKTGQLSKLFIGIAILAYITASFQSGYSKENRQPNSVIYIQDIDKNEAFFASYNKKNDEFTKQFLGDKPSEGDLSTFFSNKFKTKLNFYTKTDPRSLVFPLVDKKINDTLFADRNVYSYMIKPQRESNLLYITAKDSLNVYSIRFNGESFDRKDTSDNPFILTTTSDNPKIISYYLAEGVDSLFIEMEIPKGSNPKLQLLEVSYDLLTHPLFKKEPRSSTMMPTPFVINDAIILKKEI